MFFCSCAHWHYWSYAHTVSAVPSFRGFQALLDKIPSKWKFGIQRTQPRSWIFQPCFSMSTTYTYFSDRSEQKGFFFLKLSFSRTPEWLGTSLRFVWGDSLYVFYSAKFFLFGESHLQDRELKPDVGQKVNIGWSPPSSASQHPCPSTLPLPTDNTKRVFFLTLIWLQAMKMLLQGRYWHRSAWCVLYA